MLSTDQSFYLRLSPIEQATQLLTTTNLNYKQQEDGVQVYISETDLPALVRHLVTNGIDMYRIEARHHSLEDLFLKWTTEAEVS